MTDIRVWINVIYFLRSYDRDTKKKETASDNNWSKMTTDIIYEQK